MIAATTRITGVCSVTVLRYRPNIRQIKGAQQIIGVPKLTHG
jgi:hypothetical protein